MGISLNELKIASRNASPVSRAAMERITGEAPKRNKYRVAPKEERTVDGIVFASKREAQHYIALRFMEKVNLIRNLKRQPRYILQPKMTLADGTKQRAIIYIADFEFERDGRTVVVDVKGMELPQWKMKAKMFRAKYQDLILEVWK
jgi:hypothetical protein